MTVTEVAEYYHIGENKLRMIADEHPEADFIIMNGNRILIKRQKFEEYLDRATVV
nr:excisionase [Bacteroides acidifaciens]